MEKLIEMLNWQIDDAVQRARYERMLGHHNTAANWEYRKEGLEKALQLAILAKSQEAEQVA